MRNSASPVHRPFAIQHRLRMPATIRSADDIAWLRAHPRLVRNLPEAGIPVCIAALDDAQSDRLRAGVAAYVRACGCGTGGALACGSLAIGFALLGVRIAGQGAHWSDAGCALAIVAVSIVCAGLGKSLGMAVARGRFRRCCDNALRDLDPS